MKAIAVCSVLATLLLPYSHGHPEKIRARAEDIKYNKNHIPIAKEWTDNSNHFVWYQEPKPPIPDTKRVTLCKSKPPAVVNLDPVADADGAQLPFRDSCLSIYRTLDSQWLYLEKWRLEAETGSSTPNQQPWMLAEVNKCAFVVTGWKSEKDDAGKKLTIEVGNDDVKNLVKESLDHHVKGIGSGRDPRVGTKGAIDCEGVHVEWQLRWM